MIGTLINTLRKYANLINIHTFLECMLKYAYMHVYVFCLLSVLYLSTYNSGSLEHVV